MAMFKFSLDPVLKVRTHQETMRKQALAKEVGRQARMVQLRRDVQAQLERELSKSESERWTRIQDLQRLHAHGEEMRSKVLELEQGLERQKVRVEAEQSRLREAHKERRLLERLKERQLEEYQYESGREEQKGMDEVAALRVSGT